MLDTASYLSSSDYTVTQELKEIRIGAREGFQSALKTSKACHVDLKVDEAVETEGEFQKRVLNLKNTVKDDKSVLVGFTRSSNAKTVALLMKGTSLRGISAGAAADLASINSNFYSVAYPIADQWTSVKDLFSNLHCTNIYGVFPALTGYSAQLRSFFSRDNAGQIIEKSGLVDIKTNGKTCVYFGSNFSESIAEFSALVKTGKDVTVIGAADWALSEYEVKKEANRLKVRLDIYSTGGMPPNGYQSSETGRRLKAEGAKEKITQPSPILAYSFDAAYLAVKMLCENKSMAEVLNSSGVKPSLMRNYDGVSAAGNLTGRFYVNHILARKP